MSKNMDKHNKFLRSSLTDISQIACLSEEAQPKEVNMAKAKQQSANSINIKYSSKTGELVIDGITMGSFANNKGEHPSADEMLEFVKAMQKKLPFTSKLANNLTSSDDGVAVNNCAEEAEQDD